MNDRHSPLRPSSARALLITFLLGVIFVAGASSPEAQSLLGSRASLLKQNEEAQEHQFSYLQTVSEVRDYAQRGLLVRVPGDGDYWVADASFPYARPEVKTFLERLSSQYHNACGEPLVVTSLTRPTDRQPRNASPLSVHPTGMAIDLRRSSRPACRAWLEKNLLSLEGDGVVEATKENHPPHYHVAVFPKPYLQYLASRGEAPDTTTAPAPAAEAVSEVRVAAMTSRAEGRPEKRSSTRRSSRIARARFTSHGRSSHARRVRVSPGDSLWSIAQRNRVSVASLKRANRMRSSHLKRGQALSIPAK
jgi:LysM repeat protein